VRHRSWLYHLLSLALLVPLSLATLHAQHIVSSVSVGAEPRGVAVNPFTGNVYVANVTGGSISVLHKSSVSSTVPVNTLPFVVAVNHKTNRIYAAGCDFFTGAGSMVVVLDGNTNQVITNISLNQSCSLGTQGIALNQFTNRVYVSDYDESQEVVIDGATNEIASRVDLAGRQPLGVAVDLFTNQEWVALDGPDGKIAILDGATDTLIDTVTVDPQVFVEAVAINPSTRRVYVTSSTSPSNLYVLNAGTRQVTATVPIGLFANNLDIDLLSNLLFVTDGQANTVVVVDGRNNKVGATVALNGIFPSGVAANPVTRVVYVTEFDSNQVEVMTER
jgi:YVTN family beta-propeller protein